MKNFIKNRYHLHLLAGGLTAVALWVVAFLSTGLARLTGIADIEIVISSLRWWEGALLGATLATIAGLIWETYHYFVGNAKYDVYDVLWTAMGGLIIGGIIL